MKIIIFTSEDHNGGIMQFTVQIVKTLITSKDIEVLLFAPNEIKELIDNSIKNKCYFYQRKRSLLIKNKIMLDNMKVINLFKPDFVFFTENSPISLQMMLNLKSDIKSVLYIHDVTPHLMRMNIRRTLVTWYQKILLIKAFKKAHKIILLSENSYNKFISSHSTISKKAVKSTLCSHVPNVESVKPTELKSNNYFLFFGRIDIYKGVESMIDSYLDALYIDSSINKLVIAGKGNISDKYLEKIKQESNITFINRFISDGEMTYLFKNCYKVILPYLEASQSGVLPIAYYFGKPVIARNISGLLEFVINKQTGSLFAKNSELTQCFIEKGNHINSRLIIDYHNEHFDMQKILDKLMEVLND